MKIKAITIVMLFFCIKTVLAQGIEGTVYDIQSREPVVGAVIENINNHQHTISDHQGNFNIKASFAENRLSISVLGFKKQELTAQADKKLLIALEPATGSLNEVIVTANREAGLRTEAPIAISKLDFKTIDETKATSAYEVLNKVPGVVMGNLNNEQHFMSIRQPLNSSNYYLYLEDGIPIRPMGVFNHNALLEVNQFAISNIEVVKGPSSSIYGPEAIGGTVNFITQRPTAIPTAKIGIQFDQFGYKRVQFGAGARLGKFGFYVAGLTSKQTDSWLANSDYDKTSVNTRLEYHFTPTLNLSSTLVYSDYDSQTGGNTDSLAFYSRLYTSTSDFTYRKSKALRANFRLEKEWNKSSNSFITAFYRNNVGDQNPAYYIRWIATNNPTTATGQINSNKFKSYGFVAQHNRKFSFLNSKLLGGVMYDYSPNTYGAHQIDLNAELRPDGKSVKQYTIKADRPDIVLANYDAKINNSAIYTQYDVKPIQNLNISAGLRYDLMSFSYENFLDASEGDKKYQKLTPKIGATYDLGHDKGIYANFSTGFAPPGLTSVFTKNPLTNGFYYNLKAATFTNYEVGAWVCFFESKLCADVALYVMKGKNELLNIRQADNSYQYQSAGETLHRGIELGFTAKPSTQITLRFGGTVALHRFEDFEISTKPTDPLKNLADYEMPSAPRYSWNTELSYYPVWFKNLRTSVEWQHVGSYYQNQINTVKYEGYELLNFHAGYKFKGIELFGKLVNLTDELYAVNATRGNGATDRTTFTPAAPRTFVFGIQYNFTSKHK
jgi:outer membrane receptor protein involved in Fe transport